MKKILIVLAAIGQIFVLSLSLQAQTVTVKFDKKAVKETRSEIVIGGKTYKKKEFIKKITRQLKVANKKNRAINPKAQNFSSIDVTKDCSASVTCGNGEKISCKIEGPGSCESGTFSVACISANTETHDACGPSS